jgi:hypothetical protein
MAGPWEKYGGQQQPAAPAQAQPKKPAPWERYAAPAKAAPAETSLGSFASNLAGGAVDATLTLPGAINDLMLMGVDKIAQQFGAKPLTPEQYANNPFGSETVRGMLKDYVSPDIFGPEAKTDIERYARRVGEFVGPGAALAPVKLMRPVITAGITGGLGSQAAQDAFPDSALAPVIGGLVGGLTPSSIKAARAARLPTGALKGETAKLAKQMMDEGIPIYPGQVGSKATKIVYDAVSKLPFMGTKARETQLKAFNAAIARTFGEKADEITPTVMARAKNRIGREFNRVFANNNIMADKQLLDDLADVQLKATTNLTDAQANDIGKMIASILNETNKGGGILNGRKYHAFTSKGGALQNLVSSTDPNIKFYAGKVRELLDDAFERSATNADDVKALRTAKTQYRAMKVIEDLVSKSQDGNISPALLLGRVMSNDKSMAYTGGGKLGTLARGAQQFLKEVPGSQTAERQVLYGALGTVGAGGAYMAPQAIIPAAAVFAGAKGIKALLESRKLGARIVAQAIQRASTNVPRVTAAAAARQGARGAVPGAVGVGGRGQSIERKPSQPAFPPQR